MEEISRDIIRNCQNGSAECFANIVALYERPLFSFVYRLLTGSHREGYVEDAVQEIFLKAYKNIRGFRTERKTRFSNWLFTIARNHCLSLLRKRGIRTRSLDDEREKRGPMVDARSRNPGQEALQKEMMEKMTTAVAQLPEGQKSAILLRHYECLSYEDIAQILDCSVGTVKSRIFRARENLMHLMEDYLSL